MPTTRPAIAWQHALPPVATFVLVALAIGFLSWARPVLMPVALALLLAFLLNPVVTALQRRGLRRAPAVIIIVGGAGLCLASFGWILATQFVSLADQLPVYQENVAHRISELREQGQSSLPGKIQAFVDKITAAATEPLDSSAEAASEQPQPVKVTNGSTWNVSPLVSSAGQAIELLATMGLVVVLVVFMLLNREDVRSRLVRLLGEGRMTLTTKALDDAAQRIGRYLLAQLGLNTAFGLFIGGGLWLADVPYALVWGFCAALLRYFPFIGPWVATILPLTFSLLTADGWLQPLAVVLLFVVCEILCNLVFEPWLYGQSIGVSQAALLVAIAFWTWLWGPGGLLLAPPLTVCLVVLGKYVPALKFFDILLGDEPALTPEVTYYQRLLARDQDEASDLIREQFQEHSPEETFDRILIPALGNARRDLDANRVTEGDFDFIVGTTGEIVEELDLARPQDEHDLNGDECMVGRLEILLCAARDGIDQTALFMLQRLLDSKKYATEFVSNDRLVSEVVDLVASESPSVVCISALPPGGLAHTRLLCKRLRQRFPELKIIVGRWGLKSNIESNREQLLAAGADQLGTTIAETCAQIRNLRQRAAPRPAAVVTGPPIPR